MNEHLSIFWQIITGVLGFTIALLIYIWQSTVMQFRKHIREIKEKTDKNELGLHELEIKVEKILKEVYDSQHEIVTNYNDKFKGITELLHLNHEEILERLGIINNQIIEQKVFCKTIQDKKEDEEMRKRRRK